MQELKEQERKTRAKRAEVCAVRFLLPCLPGIVITRQCLVNLASHRSVGSLHKRYLVTISNNLALYIVV